MVMEILNDRHRCNCIYLPCVKGLDVGVLYVTTTNESIRILVRLCVVHGYSLDILYSTNFIEQEERANPLKDQSLLHHFILLFHKIHCNLQYF